MINYKWDNFEPNVQIYNFNIMIGSILKLKCLPISRNLSKISKYYTSSYDVYNPIAQQVYQSYTPLENKK